LTKRESAYAHVFNALVSVANADRNAEALRALMQEPDDDPNDLEALDKAWAEEQVTFGPDKVGCPKAEAMIARMKDAAA
jgi:nitrate reductase delta subunit